MHGYPEYSQPPTTAQSQLFLHEQEILRELNDPRIPRLVDLFMVNNSPFMVQEYIAGLPLSTAISRGRVFTEAEIKNILQQLLEIIIYLYTPTRRKPLILHRDLRLSNLILDRNKLYLIDFGFAVRSHRLSDLTLPEPPTNKTAAAAAGYIRYRRTLSPASDLFGAGLVAADLMDSRLPYAASQDKPVCSDDFSEFIGKLLKADSGYETATAAWTALLKTKLLC